MKFEEWLAQQDGVIEVDCGCVTTEAFYHWMRVAYEAGNSPVIPDGSVSMLRRWLAFGRGMQNAGSQLPHNLIAETENMLAAAPQPQNAPQNIPEIIPGWIPVSERLPEKNQSVLISVNFDSSLVDPLICTARYTGSTFRRGEATVKPGSGIEEVTHWMPLPAAPQLPGCEPATVPVIPARLVDSVTEVLRMLDEYPEQLVPVNRKSALIRELRGAVSAATNIKEDE